MYKMCMRNGRRCPSINYIFVETVCEEEFEVLESEGIGIVSIRHLANMVINRETEEK